MQNEPAVLIPGLDMETERVPLLCQKCPGIKRHIPNIERAIRRQVNAYCGRESCHGFAIGLPTGRVFVAAER